MSALPHLDDRLIKANGVHYTPPDLASFLAQGTVREAVRDSAPMRVLDPACGDGGLLRAVACETPRQARRRLELIGYETDATAAANAERNLSNLGVGRVEVRICDFLERVAAEHVCRQTHPLFHSAGATPEPFDVIISNPPYVRTQVLGARESRRWAGLFALGGRVDLYHAFVKAIALVLRPGGVLGLLASNRFMLTRAGASVRELFRHDFDLRALYDLGDTKIFAAAVLPAILIARRNPSPAAVPCPFTRVYEARGGGSEADASKPRSSLLTVLKGREEGVLQTSEGRYRVERGELDVGRDRGAPWSLSSARSRKWLSRVRARCARRFGEIAQVRVGIKTTADAVFIRDDWDELPAGIRPEPELLKPLLTHDVATRWRQTAGVGPKKRVLYPHELGPDGVRRVVDLEDYPRARAYLRQHRAKLESRRYVIESGRKWYEIWVPQPPGDWSREKIVYPDISEGPRFFLDVTGAVVNGDCYWITRNRGTAREWLLLLLAVANSSFITAYYDAVFHNKLYAGRRRFMTQYVREFPLPERDRPKSRRIVAILSDALDSHRPGGLFGAEEDELDALVWSSFGLCKEVMR